MTCFVGVKDVSGLLLMVNLSVHYLSVSSMFGTMLLTDPLEMTAYILELNHLVLLVDFVHRARAR
jgi:hypothetical protein